MPIKLICFFTFCLLWGFSVSVSALEAPVLTYGTTGENAAAIWTPIDGATGYNFLYAPMPYEGPDTIHAVDMGTQTEISVDLPTGAAFYIAVEAYNSDETSELSNIGEIFVDPANPTDNPVPPGPSLESAQLLGKALPDECYQAAELVDLDADPPLYTHPGGVPPAKPFLLRGEYTCREGRPKTNEAYVWGLAKAGDRLWFGTGANVNCMVIGGYYGGLAASFGNVLQPEEYNDGTDAITQVCQFGGSWVLNSTTALIPELGDWREPSIHMYDLATAQMHYHLEDGALAEDPVGKARLAQTLGIRSAGAIGDIAFLAGPDFSLNVNVFAFRSSTGEYLGSYSLENYSNIRKWKVIDGHLYTTLSAAGDNIAENRYGHVLKWVGTQSQPLAGPNGSAPFVLVGTLPGQGAEISEYGDSRMAVSTWPGGFDEIASGGDLRIGDLQHAGIYLSGPIPPAGLNPETAETNFTEVFNFGDYDPDMARSLTHGGGALAYFDDHLVWGSMHVPGTAGLSMWFAYAPFGLNVNRSECRELIGAGQENCPWTGMAGFAQWDACVEEKLANASEELQEEYAACLEEVAMFEEAGRQETTSIFRGRNLEAEDPDQREIDVLYGYETMKAYRFDTFFGIPQFGKGSYEDLPNGIGTPVFGGPGFGNPTNSYTWEMRIVGDRLFVGTFDRQTSEDATDPQAGFDLYSFTSARRAAVKESDTGLGNPFNYGIRTMLPGDGNRLFIGTANPYNLQEDGLGGWELIEVEVQ